MFELSPYTQWIQNVTTVHLFHLYCYPAIPLPLISETHNHTDATTVSRKAMQAEFMYCVTWRGGQSNNVFGIHLCECNAFGTAGIEKHTHLSLAPTTLSTIFSLCLFNCSRCLFYSLHSKEDASCAFRDWGEHFSYT